MPYHGGTILQGSSEMQLKFILWIPPVM